MKARYIAIPTVGTLRSVLPVTGLACILLLWWLLRATNLIKEAWVPHPWETAKAFFGLFGDGTFARDGWASIKRIAVAMFYSILVGIPIGVAMGAFGRVEAFLRFLIFPFRTAPITAFIPLFFLVFGVKEEMKVWFLFFGTVVYIIPLTFDAVRAVPTEYVDAAVDFGFSPFGTLWHFVVPAAWPRIFDAIIVCTGIAWTYLVAAEIAFVTTGLGSTLYAAQRFQNTPRIWATIALIMVIANLTDFGLKQVRQRFFNWEV